MEVRAKAFSFSLLGRIREDIDDDAPCVVVVASDFTSLGTAADVAGHFKLEINYRVYLAVCFVILWWMVAFRIRRHIRTFGVNWLSYFTLMAGGLAFFAMLLKIFILSTFLSTMGIRISYFNTMNKSYRNRGTALIFARSLREAVHQKPNGYSVAAAQEIANRYRDEKDAGAARTLATDVKVSRENPNIIVLLDEAFCDLQTIGKFETTSDPIPFVHSLQAEGYPNGNCYVSGLGGRTANTEFEFLT